MTSGCNSVACPSVALGSFHSQAKLHDRVLIHPTRDMDSQIVTKTRLSCCLLHKKLAIPRRLGQASQNHLVTDQEQVKGIRTETCYTLIHTHTWARALNPLSHRERHCR